MPIAEGPSFVGNPLNWSLFFARQPEPDLEFTEEELEQTTTIRSPSPMKPPKKSSGPPLLWVLVLIVIGAGAYVAMEPEMITEYVGPLLGESPSIRRPWHKNPRPVPPVPATQPQTAASTPPAAPVGVLNYSTWLRSCTIFSRHRWLLRYNSGRPHIEHPAADSAVQRRTTSPASSIHESWGSAVAQDQKDKIGRPFHREPLSRFSTAICRPANGSIQSAVTSARKVGWLRSS